MMPGVFKIEVLKTSCLSFSMNKVKAIWKVVLCVGVCAGESWIAFHAAMS